MLFPFNFVELAVIVETLCNYLETAAKKSHKVCLLNYNLSEALAWEGLDEDSS